MTTVHVLRDSEEALLYLAQGAWRDHALAPDREMVQRALEWAYELAAAGEPLPPLRFLSEAGHLAFGLDREETRPDRQPVEIPGWPRGLSRRYEDFVLGKLYVDGSFERGADAICAYQGRDRARALAFLMTQFRARAGFGGVLLSPGVVKTALRQLTETPGTFLRPPWLQEDDDIRPLLLELYEELIATVRDTPEALAPEDVVELERGTALAEFGQRVALRQVVQAASRLEEHLPQQRVPPDSRRQEVPTRILDEDMYPVGGFSSISNRGSIESLLHSQLAYIETDERPDLFDIKFLRDELFYYSRDENQFLRQRRTVAFALFPDLVEARFKDPELPCQRIVLLLATLVVSVKRLTQWLSNEALEFEFLFLEAGESCKGPPALEAEQNLVEMLLKDQIENGTVHVERILAKDLAKHCDDKARRSLCHYLTVAASDQPVPAKHALLSRLRLAGPFPQIGIADDPLFFAEVEEGDADDAFAQWGAAVKSLLALWV